MRHARIAVACLGIAFAAVAAAQDAQVEIDYRQAKRLADADEASVTGPARVRMLDAQKALLDAAVFDCAQHQARDDFSPFAVALELDATGKVVRTWREGASPLAICVQRYVRDKQAFVPPVAPFHSVLEVSFTK